MYISILCIHVHLFLVFAFRDARFLSGLSHRFSYIVVGRKRRYRFSYIFCAEIRCIGFLNARCSYPPCRNPFPTLYLSETYSLFGAVLTAPVGPTRRSKAPRGGYGFYLEVPRPHLGLLASLDDPSAIVDLEVEGDGGQVDFPKLQNRSKLRIPVDQGW